MGNSAYRYYAYHIGRAHGPHPSKTRKKYNTLARSLRQCHTIGNCDQGSNTHRLQGITHNTPHKPPLQLDHSRCSLPRICLTASCPLFQARNSTYILKYNDRVRSCTVWKLDRAKFRSCYSNSRHRLNHQQSLILRRYPSSF